jgi:hypothetical protein
VLHEELGQGACRKPITVLAAGQGVELHVGPEALLYGPVPVAMTAAEARKLGEALIGAARAAEYVAPAPMRVRKPAPAPAPARKPQSQKIAAGDWVTYYPEDKRQQARNHLALKATRHGKYVRLHSVETACGRYLTNAVPLSTKRENARIYPDCQVCARIAAKRAK